MTPETISSTLKMTASQRRWRVTIVAYVRAEEAEGDDSIA